MAAAGVMCIADGKVLLMRRAADRTMGGMWAFPAGGIEEGETPKQAAARELKEETGQKVKANMHGVRGDEEFHLFINRCKVFQPKVCEEHDGYLWASPTDLPEPLHPGVRENVEMYIGDEIEMLLAGDSELLAFDKSVRSYTIDGRLIIEVSNISKANICEYLGSEIPEHEKLGLQPNKLYKLLRCPKELEKAAKTFNKIPILNVHAPSTAWDHPKGKVVGTTGENSVFVAPYLQNSLAFWTEDSIKKIETEEQRELSPGYRYTPDMTPGTYAGESYDGVMRDIYGNHLAVVEVGRTGADVIVGDSTLETVPMVKKALSPKAALAKGALMVSAKLATDQKPDFNAILAGVTHANWLIKKPEILTAIAPFLAKDADPKAIEKALDSIDMEDDPAMDEEDDEKKEKIAKDEDDEDDKKKKIAEDEDDEDDKKKMAKDAKIIPIKSTADYVSKSEVEKQLRLAEDNGATKAIARMNAVAEAREEVLPFVGKLKMSFDSKEQVYKAACEVLGIDVKDMHPDAYRPILLNRQEVSKQRSMANDSQPAIPQALLDQFADLASIRVI